MSRVYFRSPYGDVTLYGSERAHAGWLTNNIGIAAIDLRDETLRFIETSFAGRTSHPRSVDEAAVSLRVGSAVFALPSGRYDSWQVLLNTCLALGSDPLCFMARMHAQCEIHAWVAGKDRWWLVEIIEQGRRSGLMRKDQGWEGVQALLGCTDSEPVVMSYSVCDQFPNHHVAGAEPDAWGSLTEAERWEAAMAGIQEMRFGPETLRAPFGHGKSAFDIVNEIRGAKRRP